MAICSTQLVDERRPIIAFTSFGSGCLAIVTTAGRDEPPTMAFLDELRAVIRTFNPPV
jgi:hypothetical protein